MRKILLIVFTAVFFFFLSFAITYWGMRPIDKNPPLALVEENNDELQADQLESAENVYLEEKSLGKNKIAANEISGNDSSKEDDQQINDTQAVNNSSLSYKQLVDKRVKESMERDVDFQWDETETYVGVFSENIAIFRGKPGIGGILMEETDIPIESLPEWELRNLRQGIAFSTQDEKYSILEGLHFPH